MMQRVLNAPFGPKKLATLALLLTGLLVTASCGTETAASAGGSPIEEYLGDDSLGLDFSFDSEEDEARFSEQQRQAEQKIAECMKEQGFEYIPVDYGDVELFGSEDGLEYGSREYIEKWGFEVSTTRYSQNAVGSDLVGYDDSMFFDGSDDPNTAIVEAMDGATQDAYYEALYGDMSDFSESEFDVTDEGGEDFFFEPSGCQGEAYEALWGGGNFYQEFQTELDAMFESLTDHPKIKEFEADITTCVAEAGYSFTSFDDVWVQYEDELQAVEALVEYPEPDLSEEDFETMTDEELHELYEVRLTAEAKTKLAEIQQKEIATALAVYDCGGTFEKMQEIYEEVGYEAQQQFVEDNKAKLDEYKAAQQDAGSGG